MKPAAAASTRRAVRTPPAAAVAGIIFSVLFAASVVLVEWALPSGSLDGEWVSEAPGATRWR